jgi:hypothetical protein
MKAQRLVAFQADRWRNIAWLLKNSFGVFPEKTRHARMAYKRFSLLRDTFLVTQFEPDFGERDFFNSHSPFRK